MHYYFYIYSLQTKTILRVNSLVIEKIDAEPINAQKCLIL